MMNSKIPKIPESFRKIHNIPTKFPKFPREIDHAQNSREFCNPSRNSLIKSDHSQWQHPWSATVKDLRLVVVVQCKLKLILREVQGCTSADFRLK